MRSLHQDVLRQSGENLVTQIDLNLRPIAKQSTLFAALRANVCSWIDRGGWAILGSVGGGDLDLLLGRDCFRRRLLRRVGQVDGHLQLRRRRRRCHVLDRGRGCEDWEDREVSSGTSCLACSGSFCSWSCVV